jgi:putative tricarboxylic transport membrane protein
MFDVWLMFFFGVVGFLMRENDYSLIPLILGIILGPIIEGAFLRSMLVSSNDPFYFFGSTIAILLWILTILVLFIQPISNVIRGVIESRTNFLN